MSNRIENLADLFSGVDSAATIKLSDGETLYREGDAYRNKSASIYLIESGYLKFERLSADGANAIIAILNRGQVFGPGLSGAGTAELTATAKGDARIRRYSEAAFQSLIDDNKRLAREVIAMLAERQAVSERRLRAMLALEVRERIVAILRELVGHYGGRCIHGHEVDVPLTHQEIAELVGASRPVVSAQLNAMRRKGLLSYTRDYICLNRLEAMG